MNPSFYFSSQYLVHRCLCLDSLKKGKISLYLNFLGQILFLTIAMLIGLILYANYVDCDPVLGGDATSRDEIVPLFVVKVSISPKIYKHLFSIVN